MDQRACRAEIAFRAPQSVRHSGRSADIGLIFAARCTGSKQANAAVSAINRLKVWAVGIKDLALELRKTDAMNEPVCVKRMTDRSSKSHPSQKPRRAGHPFVSCG